MILLVMLALLPACTEAPQEAAVPGPDADVQLAAPDWARSAIWYQIFVERFRNGDPTNDPTFEVTEGSWPHIEFEGWQPTPWTQDWYERETWADASGEDFYLTVQARRYGGDLQGVLDKLDYLRDLGVTALYVNPLNDAPSLHKYDARNYRHIDRNFGPDPEGDAAIIAAEEPTDPATWQWTSADSLFLELIDEVHQRGMRIILDYSWNHTGMTFWAWEDVLENQEASRYADWYEIERFDDPATPDTNEFAYRGWAGVPQLPELKKIGRPEGQTHGAIEGNLHPEVKQHVFHVTRRWMDPNGDGDPSDGLDGFRLDVAEMVPLGFWRDYRRFVRSINPEAYLVGEVWWEQWPDRMYDPAPWLQGDVFDAVMNYRWYEAARRFFAGAEPPLTASEYAAYLDSLDAGLAAPFRAVQMNLAASHDTPRLSTSLYNPGKYKYRVNPRENPDYRLDQPDARTAEIQRLVLVQQFTMPGAPHIWNGDEIGMWGADDPDNRKPIVWDDLAYDDETALPDGTTRPPDAVAPDRDLFDFYRLLIDLRLGHAHLFATGTMRFLLTDDARRLLAYERGLGEERIYVAFNASDAAHDLALEAPPGTFGDYFTNDEFQTGADDSLRFALPPRSARVLVRE